MFEATLTENLGELVARVRYSKKLKIERMESGKNSSNPRLTRIRLIDQSIDHYRNGGVFHSWLASMHKGSYSIGYKASLDLLSRCFRDMVGTA